MKMNDDAYFRSHFDRLKRAIVPGAGLKPLSFPVACCIMYFPTDKQMKINSTPSQQYFSL